MSIAIPESTRAVIAASTFTLSDCAYVFVKAGAVTHHDDHLMIVRDRLDTTVVTEEKNLGSVEVLARNPERWALLSIVCANPFYCVGFVAAIANAFTEAGLDILAVSAFTLDLVFVKDSEREAARRILTEVGFKAG